MVFTVDRLVNRDRIDYCEILSCNKTMHDLIGFQHDLLYAIAGFDEPYGFANKDELDD